VVGLSKLEKLEKKYVNHLASTESDDLLDDLMKKDIQEMKGAGWTIHNVASTSDPGEKRAVVVTFLRETKNN
jgi:hypothetical protein